MRMPVMLSALLLVLLLSFNVAALSIAHRELPNERTKLIAIMWYTNIGILALIVAVIAFQVLRSRNGTAMLPLPDSGGLDGP